MAADETCRARKTLTGSDSDYNTIGADSCFITIAGSGDQSYYNYYNLTLPPPDWWRLTATSGDFNATLNLLDAGGNLLASDTGGGGYDAQYNAQIQPCARNCRPAAIACRFSATCPRAALTRWPTRSRRAIPKPCTPAR